MRLPVRAILVVIVAPLVVLVLGFDLLWQAGQAMDRARALQDRLARAVNAPFAAGQSDAPQLIPGTTEGGTAAAFQAQVRSLADQGGTEVLQVQSAPPVAEPPLSHLLVTVHLRGTEPQIAATLRAIETAQPLIRVDQLDLQGEGQENGPLSATLSLSAWAAEVSP